MRNLSRPLIKHCIRRRLGFIRLAGTAASRNVRHESVSYAKFLFSCVQGVGFPLHAKTVATGFEVTGIVRNFAGRTR